MRGTTQVGGTHYTKDGKGTYDLCDLAADTLLPSHNRDMMKYYWRHRSKGGMEDLKKALGYIDSIVYNHDNVGVDVPMQPNPIDAVRVLYAEAIPHVESCLHRFFDENGIVGKDADVLTAMFMLAYVWNRHKAMDVRASIVSAMVPYEFKCSDPWKEWRDKCMSSLPKSASLADKIEIENLLDGVCSKK